MITESPKWLEKYNVEALPEAIRYRFTRLLKIATISEEGFRALSDEQLNNSLFPPSDNLIKQFRHILMHTAAFSQLIAQSTNEAPNQLLTWDYPEQFPELAQINSMKREELLYQFDKVIGNLYQALQIPNVLSHKIQKPYNPTISVLECVCDLSEHFYLHAQSMIDYYEKYNLPRSTSMKAALG